MSVISWFQNLIGVGTDNTPAADVFYPHAGTMYEQFGLPQKPEFRHLVKADKSLVSICVDKNAESVASQTLKLYVNKPATPKKLLFPSRKLYRSEKRYLMEDKQLRAYITRGVDNVEEILDHPFLDLMKGVNSFINSFTLWETTQRYLELTGNAYWMLVRTERGVPVEIWPLPSQWVRIIPDKETFIKGYIYHEADKSINRYFLPEEDVIHFKIPSSKDVRYGRGPTDKVKDIINVNDFMNRYDQAVFKNMGSLSLVFTTEKDLGDKQFKRLKGELRQEYGGVDRAGRIALLDGGLQAVDQQAFKPKEMQGQFTTKRIRQEIFNAFSIPEGLMDKDANRANSDAAAFQYAKFSTLPRVRRLEQKLNEKLLPMYDSRLFVAFDDPVPENKEFTLKEREMELRTGLTTVNEIRIEDGKEEVKWGSTPYSIQASMFSDSEPPPEKLFTPVYKSNSDRVIRQQHTYYLHKYEKLMYTKLMAFFKGQREQIDSLLGLEKLYLGGKVKQDRVNELYAALEAVIEEQNSRLLVTLSPLQTEASGIAIDNALRGVGASLPDAFVNAITEGVLDARRNYIRGINTTTFNNIKTQVGESIAAGETLTQLSTRVRNVFEMSSNRAITIARTETNSVLSGSSFHTYRDVGVEKKKWLTASGGDVRESHSRNASQGAVPLNEAFSNGQMYPGDGIGGGGENISCRCAIRGVVE